MPSPPVNIPNPTQVFINKKDYTIDTVWYRYINDINPTNPNFVLGPANGGTGAGSATGTAGSVVLSISPTIITPTLDLPRIRGIMAWVSSPAPQDPQIFGGNVNNVSVTAAATTIMAFDLATFFIVHDRTSGDMDVGVIDPVGGVNIIYNGTAGLAYTRLAGTGLQAAVTAGADPRVLSTFAICTGL